MRSFALTIQIASSMKAVLWRPFSKQESRQNSVHRLYRAQDPQIHIHMLDIAQEHGFQFDTVQMPVNIMDAHFRSFSQLWFPAQAEDHNIGDEVLWRQRHFEKRRRRADGLFALFTQLPLSVLITGINSQMLLDQAFEAVKHSSRWMRPQWPIDF